MLKTLFLITLSIPLGALSEVYFSPDDKPAEHLIKHLNAAHERIFFAVYTVTDPKIVDSLIRAHKRGVNVICVSEKSSTNHTSQKCDLLKDAGIPLYLYDDPRAGEGYTSIMHHKFAIIDQGLWTGSMNWTKSGTTKNQENSLYIDDYIIVERYLTQFEKVLARAKKSEPQKRFMPTSIDKKKPTSLREALVSSVERLLTLINEKLGQLVYRPQ